MARDLDQEWQASHPPKSQDDRTFRWLGINVVRLQEMPITAFDQIENPPTPEDEAQQPQSGVPAPPRRRNEMRAVVSAVRECLDPVCHADYDRVCETPAASVERLMDLWQTLVAETMGRPTQPPADSSGGQYGNGTLSTAGTSTTVASPSAGLAPAVSQTPPTPT